MIKVDINERSKTNSSGELIWSEQTTKKFCFGIRFYKYVFKKSVDDSDFIPPVAEMPTKTQVVGFIMQRINTRGLEEDEDEIEERKK